MGTSRKSFGGVGMAALAVTSASACVVLSFTVTAAASSQAAAEAPMVAPDQAPARFLEPSALPQGKRFGNWGAAEVRTGLPNRAGFCLGGMFQAEETSYRSYTGSAPKVSAQQYLVRSASEEQATELVAALGDRLQNCHKDWLNLDIAAYRDASRTASWERYRTTGVADGLTVYGVFTVPPKGFDKATHLYGVGRDGDRVTVVHLSMVGTQSQAPDDAFRSTAVRAMDIMR